MRVEILMYDGICEVTAVMALHALKTAERMGADVEAELVVASGETTITGTDGTVYHALPHWRPAETDALLVGGGWIHDVIAEGTLPRRIAEARARVGTKLVVGGVSAGAVIVGAAGLLNGRPATSHHPAFEPLAQYAEVVDARIVDVGDVITAGGGPLAAFDLPLYLLERELGDPRLAARVEQDLEHDRRGTVWR